MDLIFHEGSNKEESNITNIGPIQALGVVDSPKMSVFQMQLTFLKRCPGWWAPGRARSGLGGRGGSGRPSGRRSERRVRRMRRSWRRPVPDAHAQRGSSLRAVEDEVAVALHLTHRNPVLAVLGLEGDVTHEGAIGSHIVGVMHCWAVVRLSIACIIIFTLKCTGLQ